MNDYKKITTILLLMFFYVRSDVLFDDYAGPYSFVRNHIGFEYCPITGKACGKTTYSRRKIPNSDNWVYNASLFNYIYVQRTTTMRVIATTRGSSGRYQSLFDMTLATCDWTEFIRPLAIEFIEFAGYKYKCYSVLPGEYTIKNFVLDHERYNRIVQIPIAPYGFYRVEFRISEADNVNCFCFRLYLKVVPDAKAIRELQRNQTAINIFTAVKNPLTYWHTKN
ncbi:uncharacterized protein LOC111058845 isoform X2 [Nilaparvata lugens]|uniref:uncharacterized protein LOC111058845 isoform X2 n=1 Tax=Nilaparvata lugens TaxID=108931 RepID=UPI00193E2C06|nr:uncharacterized protein LOC111058845 isoform X2 [Nilaparvata lugens]